LKGFDRMADDEQKHIIDRLSANETRLGEAISAVTQSYTSLEGRVRALEIAETSRAIAVAREDERDKALYSRLDKIERKVDALDGVADKVTDIRNGFSKALWAVVLAVIGAVVIFVIKGGLNIH
jgi:hypothetical protein